MIFTPMPSLLVGMLCSVKSPSHTRWMPQRIRETLLRSHPPLSRMPILMVILMLYSLHQKLHHKDYTPHTNSSGFSTLLKQNHISISYSVENTPTPTPIPLRRSDKMSRPPVIYKDFHCYYRTFASSKGKSNGTSYPMHDYITYKRLSFSHTKFLDKVSMTTEPHSYAQASKDPHRVKAMHGENEAL